MRKLLLFQPSADKTLGRSATSLILNTLARRVKSLIPVTLFALASCNVHEWPEELYETHTFTLSMNFDTGLPLHKEVFYTRDWEESRANDADKDYDMRYIINVYKVSDQNDENRNVWDQFVFTRSVTPNPNYTVALDLPEGKYKFRVWADYIEKGSQSDKFYLTSDFTEIMLDKRGDHPGSNEKRDAFRGTAYGEVYDPVLYQYQHGGTPDNNAVAEMKRPMGRYEFISIDMDDFFDKEIKSRDSQFWDDLLTKAASRGDFDASTGPWGGLTRDDIAEAIGLDKYKVILSYNAFMPSSYNFYTDKPSDSSTGISFESSMSLGDDGIRLGFDYILVDDQTTMNMNMAIYNPDGKLIATTSGVEVPIARSKNTIVRGTFLTVSSGGGVTINPGFDGDDFNIEIK